MANAKKCDRCQKYYDYYKIMVKDEDGYWHPANRVKLGDSINTYCGFDVCPECLKEFFEFIRIPDELIDSRGEI